MEEEKEIETERKREGTISFNVNVRSLMKSTLSCYRRQQLVSGRAAALIGHS